MSDTKKARPNALERLKQKSPTAYFFVDLALNIAVIVLLVYTVRTYLISPFQVYGPSMCDTLNLIRNSCQEGFGEYLIVDKISYRLGKPGRGDVIVFRPPHNEEDFYIKRIIGLPGETVKIQNGRVYIFDEERPKGFELNEDYLNKDNKNKTFPILAQNSVTYKVPDGKYFVLGDNRKKSTDSRTCFKGPGDRNCSGDNFFLERARLEGKARIILWPFNKVRFLPNPEY